MNISRLMGATALAGTLFAVSPAFAQSTAPEAPVSATAPATGIDNDANQASAEADDGMIVVTGSRIRISNKLDASVPVTTVTAAELLGARGDVSLGDSLNQLPQLRSTFSQANSTGSIGTAGLSLLDLRGLGTARTLVLVNSRRVVSAVPGGYTPDVSTIPYDLVEGVDLVTGGNSAIYGSDAIAGVVNFRLRRNYEGLRLRAQGGTTTYGDRGTYLVSALGGKNFLDGRLNVTVSGEYTRANSVFYADRAYLGAFRGVPGFITSQITNAPNRNFDGVPNTSFTPGGIVFGNRSTGGTVVPSCPTTITAANAAQRAAVCTGFFGPVPVNAAGVPTGAPGTALANNYVFLPDGSIIRDSPATTGLVDNRPIGGGFLYGATATGVEDAMLLPAQDRYIANLLVSGDFSPAFKPFVEATYSRVKVEQQSVQPSFNGTTLTNAYSFNNPFLTPAARSTLITILNPANPDTATFQLNRFNNDFGTRAEFHTRQTYRAVVGAEGDISTTGNLRYEVAANYGRTENFYRTGGNVIVDNY
ncbi:MAG: TonB-dependent receptor, partial [Sphingomonadales bacterium]|nr:TonB-dependent receptor [Sphingomonadales bacterium]